MFTYPRNESPVQPLSLRPRPALQPNSIFSQTTLKYQLSVLLPSCAARIACQRKRRESGSQKAARPLTLSLARRASYIIYTLRSREREREPRARVCLIHSLRLSCQFGRTRLVLHVANYAAIRKIATQSVYVTI